MSELDEKAREVIKKSIESGDPPLVTHMKTVTFWDLEFQRHMNQELRRIFLQDDEVSDESLEDQH